MPYINVNKRDVLNPAIDDLLNGLRELESDDDSNNMEGNINYIFSTILNRVYPGDTYRNLNDAVGVLSCCLQEYYRKVAAPLEDQKEYDNGPIA